MAISNHNYRNPILRFILQGWRVILEYPLDPTGTGLDTYAFYKVSYRKWHPGYWLFLVWWKWKWRHAVHVEVQNNG